LASALPGIHEPGGFMTQTRYTVLAGISVIQDQFGE